ncbi:DUF1444 family protein [Myxococcus stipitatus]|uniref:DUF1444 family protein n=1 Tax=Myxococcus stipitatus TaxID=83455 RepID=UPI001F38B3CD|nr:DUF1444 family protein [Myxococcus stipitatus]MCE9667761.1 DUF1444 family protein [Myxococcus stipitatus]
MGFWKRLFGLERADSATREHPGETVEPREYLWREVEASLKAHPGVTQVSRLTDDYGLRFTVSESPIQVYLENLFVETRDLSPDERARYIGGFLRAFTERGSDDVSWDVARTMLLPVVRAASFGQVLGPGGARPNPLVERRTIPFLRELLVLDLPSTSAYVNHEHLKKWGVSEEEAIEAAFANLERIAQVGMELQEDKPSPLWSVDSNDSYETSRLLHPGFLASFTGRVKGRPVAIIPTRSTLLVCGDEDPVMVERLCEYAAREYQASSRGISPALYTVDGAGRVVPYRRAGDDALARRVRRGHVSLAMGEYEAQKELLEAQHAAEGVDVLVASYTVNLRREDERPLIWANWTKDEDTLLPEVDLSVFSESDEDFFAVRFAEARRLAPGSFELVPEAWPPRYRTLAWPEPAVLEQLRAVAVDLTKYEGS